MFLEDGFRTIPLSALRVWSRNPRKTIDPTKLDELAKSIKAIGVQQPLVVRPTPDGGEVLAGQRRYLAAAIAGLVEVPCIVRQLDDDQALEVAIAENASRSDVSPIEEAESIDAYLHSGRTIEQAADRFGRSIQWVTARTRLLALSPAWRSRVAADSCPLRHAELISRLASSVQETLFRRYEGRELPAFYEFERTVQLALHALSEAPFPLSDDGYPGGSCDVCPIRSDKQRDLFSGEVSDDAACLDTACWAAKVEHHWEVAQRSAKRRKLRVLSTEESALFDNGTCAPRSEWVELERAKRYDLAIRAISRTRDGRVVELASRAEYDQAAEARLEGLRAEAEARKIMAKSAKADEPEPEDEPAPVVAPPTPTPAPAEPIDDDTDEDDGAEEQANAERYAREAEMLAVFLSVTNHDWSIENRRALLRFCGLGIKQGAQAAILKALDIDNWKAGVETEDLRTLLDALLIDNVLAQAQPGEIEELCGVKPSAPAKDDGVAQMVARFEGEIQAARTIKDLGDAWAAIVSEDHRASLPALAKLWLAKSKELSVDVGVLRKLRKERRAPTTADAKEAA